MNTLTDIAFSRTRMTVQPHRFSAKLRKQRGSTIAEFGLSLVVLFIPILFPLINLFGLACGVCVLGFCAHQGASAASTQRSYANALTAMQDTTRSFVNGNFSRFVKLRPVGGYRSSGADLYIDASNYATGAVKRFGPNTPISFQPGQRPLDTSANIYECTVIMNAEIGPLVSLASVPCFASVPGLGRPARLSMSASRAVEYPAGFEGQQSLAMNNSAVTLFDQTPTATQPIGMDESGWNNPQIYNEIAAAGQTVIATQVIQVNSNNQNWTNTNISVGAGEKLWLDLRSNGLWTTGSGPMVNANGDGGTVIGGPDSQPGAGGMLVGRVGTNSAFEVGMSFENYAPNQTGPLTLIMNDKYGFYEDNVGVQTVRVILTN